MEHESATLMQQLSAVLQDFPGNLASELLIGGAIALVVSVLVFVRKRLLLWVGQWTPQAAELNLAQRELLELREKATKFDELEARNSHLQQQLNISAEFGSGVLAEYNELERKLENLRQLTNAESASILIPLFGSSEDLRQKKNEIGLSFLMALPASPMTLELKRDLVPLVSEAGYCYRTRAPQCMTRTGKDEHHYEGADRRTGYRTRDMISLPVTDSRYCHAVIQLINKRDSKGFLAEDVDTIRTAAGAIGDAVTSFVADPEKPKAVGAYRAPTDTVSVIYADLSNSWSLFKGDRGAAHSIRALNRYLDIICDAALQFGAAIDNYVGDGVIIRFNQPTPLPDHQRAAVNSAVAMIDAFENFRRAPGHQEFTGTYLRCGIASGPAILGPVGHPQNQVWRLMGAPIAVAATICQAAPRNENVILVDEAIYRVTTGRDGWQFEKSNSSALSSKADALSMNVYRLVRPEAQNC